MLLLGPCRWHDCGVHSDQGRVKMSELWGPRHRLRWIGVKFKITSYSARGLTNFYLNPDIKHHWAKTGLRLDTTLELLKRISWNSWSPGIAGMGLKIIAALRLVDYVEALPPTGSHGVLISSLGRLYSRSTSTKLKRSFGDKIFFLKINFIWLMKLKNSIRNFQLY